jgi:tricorn protease interacting factor F2/3
MDISLYIIDLDVDFRTLNYSGSVDIRATDLPEKIALDCDGLDISEVSTGGKQLRWKVNKPAKKLIVYCGRRRKIDFSVRFSGRAKEGSLQGFYRSRYNGGYVLTTQFEPTGARSFIPCVDNPTFKSAFRMSVKVDRGLAVISNMNVLRKYNANGKTVHLFADTPRMSTYLLYLGIGKFSEQRGSTGGRQVIVASVPGQEGKGGFAIDTAKKCITEYEKFYGIPYPLKKLHLIGIPEYSVGAMENWGSISFRENLLYVDRTTSESNRRLVASVLSHEIAHQWFGDLVTMKWWNDLWLNESFATYMSSKIIDIIYPEWHVWYDFLLYETAPSMFGDSLESTHPIDVKVKKPEEISQIFDEISYGKGGSVLRMIDDYVGTGTFRKGVGIYLKKFRYSNASSNDFWNSLREASGIRIDAIMKAWIRKPGYPVIEVHSGNKAITLKQRRFSLRNKSPGDKWPIPVTYRSGNEKGRILLDRGSAYISVKDPADFILDELRSGYYRVKYDDAIYSSLRNKLESINSHARMGIISDLFAFLAAGEIDEKLYLDFVDRLAEDRDYLIVSEVNNQLRNLCMLVPGSSALRTRYSEFCHNHLGLIGLDGSADEDRSYTVLRENLCNGLVMTDDRFAADLSARFDNWESLRPELKQAVAIAYARTSGAGGFAKLTEKLKNSKTDQDATKIAISLAWFKDVETVRKGLDMLFGGEMNIGHVPYVIVSGTRNPEARRTVWEWFTSNDGKLIHAYAGTGLIGSVVENVISGCGLAEPEAVRQYFLRKNIAEATRSIRKGMELLEIYLSLIKRLADHA